jgi:hypothetical protein
LSDPPANGGSGPGRYNARPAPVTWGAMLRTPLPGTRRGALDQPRAISASGFPLKRDISALGSTR